MIQPNAENQHYQSENDFWFSIYVNWEVICLQLCITKVFAAFIANKERNTVIGQFSKSVSMVRQ
jgi:hypothetical protein